MTDLKPCPFCGETKRLSLSGLNLNSTKGATDRSVRCGRCRAHGPLTLNDDISCDPRVSKTELMNAKAERDWDAREGKSKSEILTIESANEALVDRVDDLETEIAALRERLEAWRVYHDTAWSYKDEYNNLPKAIEKLRDLGEWEKETRV